MAGASATPSTTANRSSASSMVMPADGTVTRSGRRPRPASSGIRLVPAHDHSHRPGRPRRAPRPIVPCRLRHPGPRPGGVLDAARAHRPGDGLGGPGAVLARRVLVTGRGRRGHLRHPAAGHPAQPHRGRAPRPSRTGAAHHHRLHRGHDDHDPRRRPGHGRACCPRRCW